MRIAFAVVLLCAPLWGWAATPGRNSVRNVEAVRREWESVIAAKGGRDRLFNVHSFGVSYESSYRGQRWYGLEAYSFPLRVWARSRNLPPGHHIPAMIEVLNGEKGVGWAAIGGSTDQRTTPRLAWDSRVPSEHGWVYTDPAQVIKEAKSKTCQAVVLYLLETKWYQPEIVAADESTWIGKDVLVIYVKSCDGPAAYVIDPKTKLPVAYIFFGIREFGAELPPLPKRYEFGLSRFDDYVAVDGLLMPRKTTYGEMKYEINRDYPDSLFTKPPQLSDWGPWPPLPER